MKQDGLHNVPVQFDQMNNTIECSSKIISLLVEHNQPVKCIETILPFLLSICGSGIFNANGPKEQKIGFLQKKLFHINPTQLPSGEKGAVKNE